jgi:hypothetical protein
MIKCISRMGLVLFAALALSSTAVSSASANLALGCYKAKKESGGGKTGDYSAATCSEESKVASLKGEYVLAEPLELKKGELWCAKLTPTVKTGLYEDSACSKAEENGTFTEVLVPPKSTVLPEFSTETAANGTSGKNSLDLEGTDLECESSTTALGAGHKLGTFTITFHSCKASSKACTGLGESSGSVGISGTWHLVSSLADRTQYEIWFLIVVPGAHIECESTGIGLVVLLGNLLGSIEATSERTYKVDVTRASTTKQSIEEFGNNSGETVKASGLKGKFGTGSERIATEELESDLLSMTSLTSIKES